MNYEELSDFEINKLVVAMFLGVEPRSTWIPALIPDYCNDPEHAWPIIVESNISITDPIVLGLNRDSNEWMASKWFSNGARKIEEYHKNPLRAAMIVYLMMQEVK